MLTWFADVLESLDSQHARFYGLTLATILAESYFAFRAQAMYAGILNGVIADAVEMTVVRFMTFLLVLVGGYFVATYKEEREVWFWGIPKPSIRFACLVIIIAHDIAGAFYISYANGFDVGMISSNAPRFGVTMGLCSLSFIPVLFARMASVVKLQLEGERRQDYINHGDKVQRQSAFIAAKRWKKSLKKMPSSVLYQLLPVELQNSAQAIINYVTNIELEEGKVKKEQLVAPALPKKTEQKAPEKPAKVIDLKPRTTMRNTEEIQAVKDKPYIGIYYNGRYPGRTEPFMRGLIRYKILYGVYPEGTPEYEQRSLDANKKLIRAVRHEIKAAKRGVSV